MDIAALAATGLREALLVEATPAGGHLSGADGAGLILRVNKFFGRTAAVIAAVFVNKILLKCYNKRNK